jgi:hypothetical protein
VSDPYLLYLANKNMFKLKTDVNVLLLITHHISGGVLCDGLRKILQLSVRQSVCPSPNGFQMITLERVDGFSSNFLYLFSTIAYR